jgi:hypothetical protein
VRPLARQTQCQPVSSSTPGTSSRPGPVGARRLYQVWRVAALGLFSVPRTFGQQKVTYTPAQHCAHTCPARHRSLLGSPTSLPGKARPRRAGHGRAGHAAAEPWLPRERMDHRDSKAGPPGFPNTAKAPRAEKPVRVSGTARRGGARGRPWPRPLTRRSRGLTVVTDGRHQLLAHRRVPAVLRQAKQEAQLRDAQVGVLGQTLLLQVFQRHPGGGSGSKRGCEKKATGLRSKGRRQRKREESTQAPSISSPASGPASAAADCSVPCWTPSGTPCLV